MKKIEEEIFRKKQSYAVEEPYTMALTILESMRRFGKVVEKENRFMTSGPRKKCVVSFVLKKMIDANSRLFYVFNMNGESNAMNFLEIDIRGYFQMRISKEGYMKNILSDFYIEKILPNVKIMAKEKASAIEKKIHDMIAQAI